MPTRPPKIHPSRKLKVWRCHIKLPDRSRYSVSLRLRWPGNYYAARDRAAALQLAVDARCLDESVAWLGDIATESLKVRLGRGPLS